MIQNIPMVNPSPEGLLFLIDLIIPVLYEMADISPFQIGMQYPIPIVQSVPMSSEHLRPASRYPPSYALSFQYRMDAEKSCSDA